MALCIPAVGESDDCAKAAISLERSNSFPWPEDQGLCPNSPDPFPSQRVGSGHETRSKHNIGGGSILKVRGPKVL